MRFNIALYHAVMISIAYTCKQISMQEGQQQMCQLLYEVCDSLADAVQLVLISYPAVFLETSA